MGSKKGYGVTLMSKIREDIFPNMVPVFQSKESIIEGYVNEAFESVSALFSTKEQLIDYIYSLDSHETAELFKKNMQILFNL
jgi:hypothetical protein